MSIRTNIEWCDSTFSAWMGCTKISQACDHCYAERWGKRFGVAWGVDAPRKRTSQSNWRQPLRWNSKRFMECGACGWRGECAAELIGCGACGSIDQMNDARRRVFSSPLADVFDNAVPEQWRCDLFDLIAKTPHLDWLLLSKRIGNAREMLTRYWTGEADGRSRTHIPSIWIGTTICNREEMLRDGPKLKALQSTIHFSQHFWSVEPMLGDIGEIPRELMPSWVICGSESGPRARRDPAMLDRVRGLRDQCSGAGVPFFWKQDTINGKKISTPELDGKRWTEVPA